MTWITWLLRQIVNEWNSDSCEPAMGELSPEPRNELGITQAELDEFGDNR